MASVDENMAGATLVAVATENATSVSVDDERFEVADGNLKLKDDMSLDFEGDDGGSVDVTITASGDGDSAMHTVTVTINDVQEASMIDVRDGEVVPVKGANSSLTIDENTVHDGKDGEPLALIEIIDPDAADPTTGDDAVAAVSIRGDMAEYFQVILDPENGLWLAMTDGTTFDYETVGGEIMLTVVYTDSEGTEVEAEVTVTINDVNEAPELAEDGEVADAVFEGGAENSMTVDLKALFSDPDGDTLTYRLSDNAPDWVTFSVTTSGSHHDQTVMGTISGTPPADMTDSIDGVSIIAMDPDGMTAEVSFDIVVDAENAAPTRLDLRVTEDDGVVVRVTAVEVDENAKGAVLGSVRVHDADDARHPHGQHDYTFEVDGEADDRFEVTEDGHLKLKDDAHLNFEAGEEITLKITATDRQVTAPAEGEDPTNASVSQSIKITVKDVAAGDGPVALKTIGDWWVTVDDDLDADDVRDGDWLSFRLDTTGDDAAFTDEDGDDLTYTVSVVDSDGRVVDWLQISDSGMMTNKAGMLPERGVYTVTVTATDEGDNSAQTSFTLAVALSDDNDRDNDTPDIRDVEEFDYTEGSGSQKVASFSVRDDDVAIAPHPYGVMDIEFTATQEGDGGATTNVTNRLKIMEVGRDEDSIHYEVHTKSAAELAVDDKGMALPAARVPKPLDYENGDEVDITVTVTDGAGEEDDKDITFDLVDAADEAPAFQASAVEGGRRVATTKTTTVTVDQEAADKQVIVVQLSEAWEDADTDDDELDFSVNRSGLADTDWITVYGPDDWEDIYERQRDVDRGDAGSDVRDRDIVIAIVIDRSAMGDNEGTTGGSFTVTARDDDGNSATETIAIAVKDINTDIATGDADKVVSIMGDPSGTAPLMMNVNLGLDPDLDDADDATLVVYTWSHDNATPADDADDVTISVSSTPQSLPLVVVPAGTAIYPVGTTFTATVQYYEIDPVTKAIIESATYTDSTDDPTVAPEEREEATNVVFEVTTDATGVLVDITATGDARSATGATGNVRLQASTDGESGWLNVATGSADTSSAAVTDVDLDVDANGDGTTVTGDGGGLYYRVVYTDDDDTTHMYDVGQLGDLSGGDPTDTTPAGNIIGGSATDNPDVGETLRVANAGNDADVQWQMRANANMPWRDIDGATHLELEVDSDYAGMMLRARVTYTADDNPATTDVDEEGWPIWIEYTEVLTVSGADVTNDAPEATQATYEIRVETLAKPGTPMAVQPTTVVTDDASSLFFDPDGDDLTYTITAAPDLDVAATAADAPGTDSDLGAGGSVYRVYTAEWNATDSVSETTEDVQQSLSIDRNTGEITYFTDKEQGHDNDTADGGGNTLTFTITATDNDPGTTTPPTATVTVRINVAPTAINLNDGTTAAADLPAPGPMVTGTALTVADDTNQPADDDSDPDMLTFTDDAENAARKVADINVADQNASSDGFGTHKITLSGKGSDMFEVRETDAADTDGSTWEIWLKDDAKFDFEALKGRTDTDSTTLVITVTATDSGGLSTKGVFSVQLVDADTDDDAAPPPPPPDAPDPEVPGLEDDADDSDNDGPVIPPDDGGAFIDDLLDQFVVTIDDIDIA